jgi:hypothetical protein
MDLENSDSIDLEKLEHFLVIDGIRSQGMDGRELSQMEWEVL